MLAGCVGSPRSRHGLVVLNDAVKPDGKTPAVVLGEGRWFGWRSLVLDLEDENEGTFRGIEGSPVLDVNGRTVAVVTERIGSGPSRLVRAIESDYIDLLWQRDEEDPHGKVLDVPHSAIAPGAILAVGQWWGDSIGMADFLTVSDVRGDRFLGMTKTRQRGRAVGPCLYVICEARAVGYGMGGTGRTRLCKTGEPIGLAYYDGSGGVLGLLGKLPESVGLDVSIRVDGIPMGEESIRIVRSKRCVEWMRTCLEGLFARYDLKGQRRVVMRVRTEQDGPGDVFEFWPETGNMGTLLLERLQAYWEEVGGETGIDTWIEFDVLPTEAHSGAGREDRRE